MPKRPPSSSSGSLVPGGNACSMMACRNAWQARSTRVDFLLISVPPDFNDAEPASSIAKSGVRYHSELYTRCRKISRYARIIGSAAPKICARLSAKKPDNPQQPKELYRRPNCIHDCSADGAGERKMQENVIKLQLNQQQLELMDRT